MGFYKDFIRQTKKPEGRLGKMMVSSMNTGHAKMASWGTGHLDINELKHMIDLGCGGGKNAQDLMLKYPQANMCAIDYSSVSVEASIKRNEKAIEEGRCKVLQADVSKLPLKDETYDLATAFETIYFWPGPLQSFQEVYRILKNNAYFMIVNECDGTNEKDQKWVKIIDGMVIYSKEEVIDYLKQAGFEQVQVYHNDEKHWICFIAHKK